LFFEFLKARMISALILLISKSDHEAEYIVAIDVSKVGIVGILLQNDAARSLRSYIYWARMKNDCKANYIAYDCEALVVIRTLSPASIIFLIGCKCFSVVIDHATFNSWLKQPNDRLANRQVHYVEPLMSFPQCTSILYC